MSELDVTEERVREERVREVDQRAHWLTLLIVLCGSVVLMLGFLALLDATT